MEGYGMARKAPRGKTSKSEQVSIRLEPKIHYGLELLARQQHRTIAAVIEASISKMLVDTREGLVIIKRAPNGATRDLAAVNEVISVEAALDKLWQTQEADRLAALAFHKPELLSYEEKQIWEQVQDNGCYWIKTWCQFNKADAIDQVVMWDVSNEKMFIYPTFRQLYPLIKQYTQHEITEDVLLNAIGSTMHQPVFTRNGHWRTSIRKENDVLTDNDYLETEIVSVQSTGK